MADNSKIEWTNATWNPIAGCTRVGKDCVHCYAERMANRLQAMGRDGYKGTIDTHGRWNGTVNVIEKQMDLPFHWRRGRRVFVNSMSDFFHDGLEDRWRCAILGVIHATPHHTYTILTKRPENLRRFVQQYPNTVSPNIEWGVSVCDNETAAERLPHLIRTKGTLTRIISYEPALGPLNVEPYIKRLNGIIAGGESGYGARPDNPAWYRQIRDVCVKYKVPFFFKQYGSHRGKVSHRLLDGVEWNQLPRRASA